MGISESTKTTRTGAMMNVRLIGSRTKVAAACGAKPCRVHARQNPTHRARFEGIKSFSTPDLSDSIDEDAIASGEWPANWSLASYEDVGEYYAGQVLKEQGANSVSGVMTTNILSADPTASVEDVRKLFDHVSGGIVSKKDLNKKGSMVAQIMSAPARTIKKTN